MALVLTLRVGESFYVADVKFTVTNIVSELEVELVMIPAGGPKSEPRKTMLLTDRRATEPVHNVFLSVGGRSQLGMARVAIEAPRQVQILREAVYNERSKSA